LIVKTFGNIHEIDPALWNGLLADQPAAFTHEFWSIIERSRLNDFRYWHAVLFDDNGQPVALTGYYSITTDLAIFSPPWLRQLLDRIRCKFPNFMKLRMLEWGTPITVSSPPFAVSPGFDPVIAAAAFEAEIFRKAREKNYWLLVVRDFEPSTTAFDRLFAERGYHWVPSLPNTYLDITWKTSGDYRQALTSYYRSKLNKHLKRNHEAGVTHRLIDDFADLAETLCQQWLVVHHQADEFQREVLTPAFYRNFSNDLGARSKCLLFHRGGELVGHALLLVDGDVLRWLYFGRNEAVNDSLYLYVAHSVIETAIELGVSRLEMGLTTYSIKQDLGARITPIRLALRCTLPGINWLIGAGYRLLNNPPQPENKRVFKIT